MKYKYEDKPERTDVAEWLKRGRNVRNVAGRYTYYGEVF